MRAIDADRLLTDRMKSKYYHLPNGDTAIPIIDIEHAPTIEMPEIIRCKDCIYSGYYPTIPNWCYIHGMIMSPDDFCSYAERREESNDD